MTPVAGGPNQRVLFASNGNGEDSIAAEIIRRLPKEFVAEAYPVVGGGQAFSGLCSIVGPRAYVPSEGWRHTSGSLSRDMRGGMLGGILPAIRFLRTASTRYDRIVAIGDGVIPMLALFAGVRIDIYLDVFKTGYAHRYNAFERFVLRRATSNVFCRDDMLATALRKSGIDARSDGNVMLDCLASAGYDMAPHRQRETALVLLPGSRAWTGQSLKTQIQAIELLPADLTPDLFVALAGGIAPLSLANETEMQFSAGSGGCETGTLNGHGLTIHLVSGALRDLLQGADVVLSQAGTATQQAVGLGKPVITFNRPDNRQKRMADEQALMGQARILTEPDPAAIADQLKRLLEDPRERARLGAIGRERMGGPGTIDAVLGVLKA